MARKMKKKIVLVCLVCGCTWTPRKTPKLKPFKSKCINCGSNRVIIDLEEAGGNPPRWIPT